MHLPSKDEWAIWRENPVTMAFFTALAKGRSEMVETWARGSYLGDVTGNAQAVGRCEALKGACEMTFEEMEGYLNDNPQEYVGPTPPGPSGFAPPG